jgi:hypothetical protein
LARVRTERHGSVAPSEVELEPGDSHDDVLGALLGEAPAKADQVVERGRSRLLSLFEAPEEGV